AGFVYDDQWYIVQNPALRSLNIGSYFMNPKTVAAPGSGLDQDVYRPMGTLIFALAFHMWHLKAWPYHLANLLFHLFNTWLLWRILVRLLRNWTGALVGAFVFFWHPAQVQSVAWISQLTALIGAAGFLTALNVFIGGSSLCWRKKL